MAVDKVNAQTARKDIESWLDSKKLRQSRREARDIQIEDLVAAVKEGVLAYNKDTHELTHVLINPPDDAGGVKELKYQHRIRPIDVEPYLKGVQPTDADGRLRAWIQTLTGQPVNVIRKLDTEDYSLAQNIALFFQ